MTTQAKTESARRASPGAKRDAKIRAAIAEAAPAAPKLAAIAPAAAPPLELFRPTRHDAIRPDPANPRKLFEADGLVELAASITRDGLLEPLVIRAVDGEPGAFMLIAGERRWRAIGQAIAAGGWPADRAIPAMLRDVTEADARRLALVENLQRRDLNPIEQARAIEALVELTGSSAAQVGEELGFTPRWAQQRLSLLKLPDALQRQVEAGAMKIEDARQAAEILPKLPPIKREEILRGATTVAAARAWLAEQPTPLSDAAKLALLEFMAKAEAAPFKPNDYTTQSGALIAAETRRVDHGPNGVRVSVKVADPTFAELTKAGILDDARPVKIEGVETGAHFAQLNYYPRPSIERLFPEALREKARPHLIVELRVKLHGLQRDYELTQSGAYATAWLNAEPVEPTAEVAQAIVDAKAARERQAEEYRQQEKEKAAERAAETAEHKATLAAIVAAAEATIAAPDRAAALAEVAARFGHPLPWFHTEQSEIVDAAGGQVIPSSYHYERDAERQARRLMVALVNAAAGLATPSRKPSRKDPAAPPRESFTFQVAAALSEADDGDDLGEAYLAQAERGLDAFLRQEAIDYADAEYDWGPDGVETLAHLIAVDDLGQQVDLEQAIAAAPVAEAAQ